MFELIIVPAQGLLPVEVHAVVGATPVDGASPDIPFPPPQKLLAAANGLIVGILIDPNIPTPPPQKLMPAALGSIVGIFTNPDIPTPPPQK